MTFKKKFFPLALTTPMLLLLLFSCQEKKPKPTNVETYADVQIAGAMKDVMWKGKLGATLVFDSLIGKPGLYGLGPESYLTGELLLKDGVLFTSRVGADSSIEMTKNTSTSAPFFVYTEVNEWESSTLPNSIKNGKQLEEYLNERSKDLKRPFAFRLEGKIVEAAIHIQNLPKGSAVSSPKEAHQGQVNYSLENESVEIVGFFSTEHQGVFTHHDSFLHMHLISQDESKMGHIDSLEIDEMSLFLPKK